MRQLHITIVVAIVILVLSMITASAIPAQANPLLSVIHSGKLTMLRVNDVGTGYGPPTNWLDVEVVIRLNSDPNGAWGFQLRDDNNRLVHQGMLDLLRDAFANDWIVYIDEENGIIFRVWVVKP